MTRARKKALPKVNRFVYIGSRDKNALIHGSYAPHMVEGATLMCGRRARLGWGWWLNKKKWSEETKARKLCPGCFGAGVA